VQNLQNSFYQNSSTLNFGFDKWLLPIPKLSDNEINMQTLSGSDEDGSISNKSDKQDSSGSLLNDEFLKDDKFNGY